MISMDVVKDGECKLLIASHCPSADATNVTPETVLFVSDSFTLLSNAVNVSKIQFLERKYQYLYGLSPVLSIPIKQIKQAAYDIVHQ